tara:strand:+ start:167 stop:853 length:687 start_codon:yes stop_codon:yes gene_type:complete
LKNSPPAEPTPLPGPEREVGERLKIAREERAFTQGVVANRTKMIDPEQKGISRTAIIAYEQGTTKPGLREIKLLCEVLHITPNWLIYGTDNAAAAALPSMELLAHSPFGQLDVVLRTAMALTALKGHERDAIQSLVLSLAGRQLGDMRLSALVSSSWMMRGAFLSALKAYDPDIEQTSSLEEVADALSQGYATNHGNQFRFDEDGEILNESQALYPDPKSPKVKKNDI